MSDRHRRDAAPHNLHTSIKLLGESDHKDRAQSWTWLIRIQLTLRGFNPVVGNRKSPARFSRLIGNYNQDSGLVADESMLECIDHELGDDETHAGRLGGRCRAAAFCLDLQ